MSPAKFESLGDCLRPWRDGRLGALLASIQRLRRSRTLGAAVFAPSNGKVSRRQFSTPWGRFETVGLLILLTFAALLLRSILR